MRILDDAINASCVEIVAIVEYSEEDVEEVSLPECEPDHDGVEAEEPSHGATEAGQRLARRSSVCGVRVGVVGDDTGQQEQT